MEILILSKQRFDAFMVHKGITNDTVDDLEYTFFISINDTCRTPEIPYFKESKNVKVLYFDDVETDLEVPIVGKNESVTAKAFTLEQAKDLLQFIERHKTKNTCILHCAAGISRSGAVGTFLNDYLKQDFYEFKRTNPHIHPNPHVLKLLKSIE